MPDTLKYKIKEGDNLTKIVKHLYDRNIDVIGDNPDLIYPDSMLTISVIPSQKEPDSIFIVDSPAVDYSIQAWGLLGCLLLIATLGLFRKPKTNITIQNTQPALTPVSNGMQYVIGDRNQDREVPIEKNIATIIEDGKIGEQNLRPEHLSSSSNIEDTKAKIKKMRNN